MDVNLIMFKENGQRKDFPMKGASCVVGRREDCDLRVPLPAVSRKHCKFLRDDKGVNVRDLASSNGTFVNNQRVQEKPLKAGDRIMIGPVVFVVQIDGNPADPKPVKTRLGKTPARPGAPPAPAKPLGTSGGEDIDPIAALEALAGATEEIEDEDEKKT